MLFTGATNTATAYPPIIGVGSTPPPTPPSTYPSGKLDAINTQIAINKQDGVG